MKETDGMEGLFRHALGDQRATDPCPEADVLAAHYEGELGEGERMALDHHISRCSRCQAHLAIIARSDIGATESAPSQAAAQVSTAPLSGRRGSRFSGWTLGWAGAAALGTAAAAVWMIASRSPSPLARPVSPVSQVGTIADSTSAASRSADSNAPATAIAPPRADTPSVTNAPSAASARSTAAPRQSGSAKTEKGSLQEDQLARAEERMAARRGTDDLAPLRESVQTSAGAGATGTPVAPATPAPHALMYSAPRSTAAPIVTSSDGQSLWRVEGVLVQHSTDGGRTWNGQVVAGSDQLTAGSAPSATVCWMVGRRGLILRYQDRGGWERRVAPEPVDLVSVTALDADHATVSTADGRQFRTDDGGLTWTGP